jgi:hypothetical protein
VITKSIVFNSKAIIPLWLAVCGLLAWSGSPMTFAMGVIVLLVGGTALTIVPLLWNPPLTLEPSAGMVPNSWPNSGFRNSSRRGAGGG